MLTPEQAREPARKHLAAIANDRDPARERKAARQAERARVQAATLADVWQDFEQNRDKLDAEAPAAAGQLGLPTRAWWLRHLEPALGSIKLGDLTRGKVQATLREIAERAGQSTSNRCLAVLSTLLSLGRESDRRRDPALPRGGQLSRFKLPRYAEPGRERLLTDDELGRLIRYLAASAAIEARVVELLLATGARRGEALGMKWTEVDGAWWRVPAERIEEPQGEEQGVQRRSAGSPGQARRASMTRCSSRTNVTRLETVLVAGADRAQARGCSPARLRHAAASHCAASRRSTCRGRRDAWPRRRIPRP